MWFMSKSKLNFHDRLDRIQYMMKNKKNNNLIDLIGVISVKCNTELSRSIGQCALYDKNETRQQHDQSYRSSLCRKQN